MVKSIEAVYEAGVLRPLEPLDLVEGQPVRLTVSSFIAGPAEVAEMFTPEEWAAGLRDEVSLEDVRKALSRVEGSLAETAIELRNERF